MFGLVFFLSQVSSYTPKICSSSFTRSWLPAHLQKVCGWRLSVRSLETVPNLKLHGCFYFSFTSVSYLGKNENKTKKSFWRLLVVKIRATVTLNKKWGHFIPDPELKAKMYFCVMPDTKNTVLLTGIWDKKSEAVPGNYKSHVIV